MAFKIGQSIIWMQSNPAQIKEQIVQTGTVTKLGKDTVYVDNHHAPEDQLYAAFCYPDILECRLLLETTIAMKARHEREHKEMLTAQMQMNNEMVRRGLK